MTIYLCGPINGCTDEECVDWREMVKTAWLGETLDPMRRDFRQREDAAAREIVEKDKRDIDACDALLVNHPKPSVGTAMEILYAWERGKAIVVVAPRDMAISPWLRYHATKIVHSFEDALACLEELGGQ